MKNEQKKQTKKTKNKKPKKQTKQNNNEAKNDIAYLLKLGVDIRGKYKVVLCVSLLQYSHQCRKARMRLRCCIQLHAVTIESETQKQKTSLKKGVQ